MTSRPRPRWRLLPSLALAASAALADGAVLAHGDDDHKETPAASSTSVPTAGGTGDVFEVVVKHAASPGAGGGLLLRVYVSDAETNAPVTRAEVELTLSAAGRGELKVAATPTVEPGVYLASAALPATGDFNVVASVRRGEAIDLVVPGALHVGAEDVAGAGHPHESDDHRRLALLGGLAGLGVALAVAVALGRAKVRRASGASDA